LWTSKDYSNQLLKALILKVGLVVKNCVSFLKKNGPPELDFWWDCSIYFNLDYVYKDFIKLYIVLYDWNGSYM